MSYLGWADIALSTVSVEGRDESLTQGAESNRRKGRQTNFSTTSKSFVITAWLREIIYIFFGRIL